MVTASPILDSSGSPFVHTNGHPRRELIDAMRETERRRLVKARYDAAQPSDEFDNYWARADHFSPDESNSKAVRQALVSRSRYESESNGLADGMVQANADYIVSSGPTLRMQTSSARFNAWVEREWEKWARRIHLRRKLHTMAQAKTQDGESLAIIKTNPRLKNVVKVDLKLIETEQCQTPFLGFGEVGHIDGINFDEFDNVVSYDILRQHPGGTAGFSGTLVADVVQEKYVCHWFSLRRPGLHRGVPETRSTLNVGASSRRMREATVSAVETAASLGAALLETENTAFTAEEIAAGSSVDLRRRMMTVLPVGYKAKQMDSKFPNATYQDFQRQQTSEQARPICMPHNLAAADSSQHNFASGRLDFLPYYLHVDCTRQDADDLVLEKIFLVWYEEASLVFGWVMFDDGPPRHSFDWPPHPVVDPEADVATKAKALTSGQLSLTRMFSQQGLDFDDELPVMANDCFGTDEENKAANRPEFATQELRNIAMRDKLGNTIYNSRAEQASILQVEQNEENERRKAAQKPPNQKPAPVPEAAQ